jgi:hypothetical protein
LTMSVMEWLGDLERAFATGLYPLRVPIAIGVGVATLALILVAGRRGWFASARRHPLRTGAFLVAALAVTLPVAWYLGSPLFIRTALVEPAPSSAPKATVDTIETIPPSNAPTAGVPPTTAPASPSPQPPRSGNFTGADDFHFGRGRATLIETAPGTWVVRFESFSVRNGPDLFVYLSPDPAGYVKSAVELGRLKATDGDFNVQVPAGTEVSQLHSIVIWCKQFAVQFAVAPLS